MVAQRRTAARPQSRAQLTLLISRPQSSPVRRLRPQPANRCRDAGVNIGQIVPARRTACRQRSSAICAGSAARKRRRTVSHSPPHRLQSGRADGVVRCLRAFVQCSDPSASLPRTAHAHPVRTAPKGGYSLRCSSLSVSHLIPYPPCRAARGRSGSVIVTVVPLPYSLVRRSCPRATPRSPCDRQTQSGAASGTRAQPCPRGRISSNRRGTSSAGMPTPLSLNCVPHGLRLRAVPSDGSCRPKACTRPRWTGYLPQPARCVLCLRPSAAGSARSQRGS